MKIYLAEPRGFCSGVKRALDIVNEVLSENKDGAQVYILHEIVHNEYVVNKLLERRVMIIDEPEEAPPGSILIFSAHGVSDDVERRALSIPGLRVIDATCPLVKNVQRKAVELSDAGYNILLFGKAGHREVEGILGRLENGKAVLIEDTESAESFVPSPGTRYACLSQTTLDAADVSSMTDILKKKIPALFQVAAVCHATAERQKSVRKLAAFCDLVIVVGSENSSNSRRLCELAEKCGAKSMLVPDAGILDASCFSGVQNVALASGASAPDELVMQVLRFLESAGGGLSNL